MAKSTNIWQALQQGMVGDAIIAAGQSSLVVTNADCSLTSVLLATLNTADGTNFVKSVVPAAGSFTITLNAAAGVAVSVAYAVLNLPS